MSRAGEGPVLFADDNAPSLVRARDAVFSWLTARSQGRDFYVKVGETAASELRWLRLEWKDPPALDSEPGEILETVLLDDLLKTSLRLRDADRAARTEQERLLADELGLHRPTVIHLPPLRAPEGVSIDRLQREGWMWEAVLNHLATRGWSPPGGRRRLTRAELLLHFTVGEFQPAGWEAKEVEDHHLGLLRELTPAELIERTAPFWERLAALSEGERMRLEGLGLLLGEELNRLTDFPLRASFFFEDPPPPPPAPRTAPLIERLRQLEDWDSILLEDLLAEADEATLRLISLAITGSPEGPPLAEMMALVGRKACLPRLQKLLG